MRRNPTGLPRPKTIRMADGSKVPAQLVLSGERTHVLNPETDMLLCRSGRGGFASFVRLSESDPNAFVSCTRCNKLLAWNEERAMQVRAFPPTKKPSGTSNTREMHVMVKGGRAALRGARDAKVPEEQTRVYALWKWTPEERVRLGLPEGGAFERERPLELIPRSRAVVALDLAAKWKKIIDREKIEPLTLSVRLGKLKRWKKFKDELTSIIETYLNLMKLSPFILTDLRRRAPGNVPAVSVLSALANFSHAEQKQKYEAMMAKIQTDRVPVKFVPGPRSARTQPQQLLAGPSDPFKVQSRSKSESLLRDPGDETTTKRPGIRSRQAQLDQGRVRVIENTRTRRTR